MAWFKCENQIPCTGVVTVASLIIGIVAAFLQITAAITVTPAFLWVTFGIAVGFLAVTEVAAAMSCGCREYCGLTTVLIGILATALLSVILLAISFPATSVLGAVLVGALLFFLSLMLGSIACFVRCLATDIDD